MRIRAQTTICDSRQKTTTKKTKGIFKLGLPLGSPSNKMKTGKEVGAGGWVGNEINARMENASERNLATL